MINKILFRGKSVEDGRWIEGYYAELGVGKDVDYYIIQNNSLAQIFADPELNKTFSDYEVVKDTVSQYIGMKDKNGKRIFGGDILELADRYVEVVYDDRFVRWDCRFLEYNGRAIIFPFECVEPKDFYKYAIVGNIWDNPELL